MVHWDIEDVPLVMTLSEAFFVCYGLQQQYDFLVISAV
jgi:hypothetical protein